MVANNEETNLMLISFKIFICVYLLATAVFMLLEFDINFWNPKNWYPDQRFVLLVAVSIVEAIYWAVRLISSVMGACTF